MGHVPSQQARPQVKSKRVRIDFELKAFFKGKRPPVTLGFYGSPEEAVGAHETYSTKEGWAEIRSALVPKPSRWRKLLFLLLVRVPFEETVETTWGVYVALKVGLDAMIGRYPTKEEAVAAADRERDLLAETPSANTTGAIYILQSEEVVA